MSNYRQTKDKMLNTEAYKNMSFIQKKLSRSFTNVKNIHHAIEVIKNTSFAQWHKQTKTTYLNQLIIHDILKNEIVKNKDNER